MSLGVYYVELFEIATFRPKMVKYQQFHIVQLNKKELVFLLDVFDLKKNPRDFKCIIYQEDFILKVKILWDLQSLLNFHAYSFTPASGTASHSI